MGRCCLCGRANVQTKPLKMLRWSDEDEPKIETVWVDVCALCDKERDDAAL